MATLPKWTSSDDLKPKNHFLETLNYIIVLSIILYFGKPILIPLSLALLVSFILYPICKWLEKNKIPKSWAIAISLSSIIAIILVIVAILIGQILQFSNEWQTLELKMETLINQANTYLTQQFGLTEERQINFFKRTIDQSGSQLFMLLKKMLYSLSEIAYYLMIVPIFSALILYYRNLLILALFPVFPKVKKEIIVEVILKTIQEYYNFIKGMALVYLIVGILNSIGLAILGIPYPILFGFTASLLTFIPYVGILVSSLLPITIAWITYNSVVYPIGVVVVFGVVQILEAYIIFPYVVGSRIKINTLAILVVILLGGLFWGGVGMILFIPFLSIIKIVADRVSQLKPLAVLLGDGKT